MRSCKRTVGLLALALGSAGEAQTYTVNGKLNGTTPINSTGGLIGDSPEYSLTFSINPSAPDLVGSPEFGRYAASTGQLTIDGLQFTLHDISVNVESDDYIPFSPSGAVSIRARFSNQSIAGDGGYYGFIDFSNSVSLTNDLLPTDLSALNYNGLFSYAEFGLRNENGIYYSYLSQSLPYAFAFPSGSAGASLGAGALPEPSTWAMMIIGIGAAGYSLRKRRVSYQPSLV